jgi:ATP-dependent helicase/nuclease subunit A
MIKQLTPQQLLALDHTRNISLVANAGSGKTFVLSKRFIEIYLAEDVDLNSIVAITFTDKAAGELNRKIASEVDERLGYETDKKKRHRLERLRRELVSANISTIHSFCINILKEHAPEAGIDANFSPIDQQTSNELIELTIEETLQNLIKDETTSRNLKYLVRFFGSNFSFKIVLENAVQKRRNIEKIANNIYPGDAKDIARFFVNEFEKNFKKIFDENIGIAVSSIKRINNHILSLNSSNKYGIVISEYLDEISKDPLLKKQLHFLSLIKQEFTTTEGSVRNRGYLSKDRDNFSADIDKAEKLFDELKGFFDCDLSGNSELELARFGLAFLDVFNYTCKLYSEKKKQRSYLDFEDILLFAHKIISTESVQKYLGETYSYIMVDEYQDTNELQYEIIMPILQYLRKGNLFVVGDEKQSIYMFRDADLEIFNRTKKDINDSATTGTLLSLPHSFRMYPKLVFFTNKIFSGLFANPKEEFNEVGHNDLICTKDNTPDGGVEILLADTEADIVESNLVAGKIIELISTDASIKFSDVAILCRKRDSFSELESSFVKTKIPFTIIGGKGFYQRQTIYDIYNYLSFLLNTKDDAALIGILRSPFFNFSDAKLFLISEREGETFYDKLISFAGDHREIDYILEQIEENRSLSFSHEPYRLIRKLLLDSGYWAVLAAKQNSSQELANIEKLLSLAREYSRKGFKNLFDLVSALKEAIEGTEDEGQAQVARDENSVKMMTIHQSKGLEFKAVFIYGANTKGQEDGIRSKGIAIDKNLGLLTKVPVDQKYFEKFSTPPVAAYYNYTIKRKNRAELKRLFYVAVTRAVKHLYISATHKELKAADGSFFQLLLEGMQNNLSGSEIYLAGNVEFMRMKNDEFVFEKEKVELDVKIEHEAKPVISFESNINSVIMERGLLHQKIYDTPKDEIISATKISMFAQCPTKYELTYEIGYSPILGLIKSKQSEYEFQPNEEEGVKKFAQIRGKIIHKALSDKTSLSDIRDFLLKELIREEFQGESIDKMIESLSTDLEDFYQSESYSEINSHAKYENEFEVYCKDGDSFLYGIIDKLIFDGDRLIIVDYKTDNIEKNKLAGRADSYFPQLKFYAYVLNKLYPEVESYELRLIFLKHPEERIVSIINKNHLKEFSKVIKDAVHNIYTQNYSPNLSHCAQCQFALEGNKCVKQFS